MPALAIAKTKPGTRQPARDRLERIRRPSYASSVNICPSCGQENPEGSRFCNACGTDLALEAGAREYRKVVTVLFCDVAGSTALGESVDPEALRALLGRYFDEMKAIVERHGGSVESATR